MKNLPISKQAGGTVDKNLDKTEILRPYPQEVLYATLKGVNFVLTNFCQCG